MKRFKLVVTVLAIIGLVGCGQKDVSSEVKVSENGEETKVAYIKREDLQPFEKYTPYLHIETWTYGSPEHQKVVEQFRNIYWSSAKMNYELLAYDLVDGYADETDTFKRKDLLKANKEKLDDIYKNLPKNKYFSIRRNDILHFEKYNEELKGFRVYFYGKNSEEGFNNGGLFSIAEKDVPTRRKNQLYYTQSVIGQFNTSPDFDSPGNGLDSFVYIPKNEDEARLIETQLSDPAAEQNISRYFLGRTIGAIQTENDRAYSSLFMVDGITLVNNKTNTVIFTIDQKEMGSRYEIKCNAVAKALGLDEINGDSRYCAFSN